MKKKSSKSGKKDKEEKDLPKVNPDLKGFNIEINSFGEIVTDYDIDKINDFLDKNVEDKKLVDREDLQEKKKKKKDDSK